MKLKISYRVKNWKSYNQALRNRGDVTIWFTEDAFVPAHAGKRGRPPKYSVNFIRMVLTLRSVFRLPLRATQGFVNSLLKIHGIEMSCCDYTLLSKRAAEVGAQLKRMLQKIDRVAHVVVDSTGLKVFGEGEWKTRLYGKEKRRTWKKLHLAIDAESHEIVGHMLTGNNTNDGAALKPLLENIGTVGHAYLDGAYDQKQCYEVLAKKGARPIIPPRKNSKSDKMVWTVAEQWRNLNVNAVQAFGLESWKVGVGYHRRSLSETNVNRFKTIFTGHLQSRKLANQVAEAGIKVDILNTMTRLGMPATQVTKKWFD